MLLEGGHLVDNLCNHIILGNIPAGVTNYKAAEMLQGGFPRSFRKAQDVLVAVKKMRSGGGWFVPENVRIKRAQEEIYGLAHTLEAEGFCDLPAILTEAGKTGSTLSAQESIFVFMNFFAQVFPNWRPEYETMNRFVPQLY
jgi:hypothetical protein